jgi:hypothetical protein
MVGVWNTFSETEEKVDREVETLAALYIDVSHYPEPNREVLQDDLRRYTHDVIYFAWPQQKKGIIPTSNVAIVFALGTDLAAFEPTSEGQKVLHAESYKDFNELVERRRSRILGVTAGLAGALWSLILIGAAINIAVTWCFSPAQPKNARLDDGLDVIVARSNDFSDGGNGPSVLREVIGVL